MQLATGRVVVSANSNCQIFRRYQKQNIISVSKGSKRSVLERVNKSRSKQKRKQKRQKRKRDAARRIKSENEKMNLESQQNIIWNSSYISILPKIRFTFFIQTTRKFRLQLKISKQIVELWSWSLVRGPSQKSKIGP